MYFFISHSESIHDYVHWSAQHPPPLSFAWGRTAASFASAVVSSASFVEAPAEIDGVPSGVSVVGASTALSGRCSCWSAIPLSDLLSAIPSDDGVDKCDDVGCGPSSVPNASEVGLGIGEACELVFSTRSFVAAALPDEDGGSGESFPRPGGPAGEDSADC